MRLALDIGGLAIDVFASRGMRAAIDARFRRFVVRRATAGTVRLRAHEAKQFNPGFERPAAATLTLTGPTQVVLSGALHGGFDLSAGEGFVEDAAGLGAFDALLRAALSIALPREGALLFHAAVVPAGSGGALVLCGAPGAGKSTAAAELGGACDELAVVRLLGDRVEVHATPYWQGVPLVAAASGLLVLERAHQPEISTATGGAALRLLAPHVVRYAAIPSVERQIFALLSRVCGAVAVHRAACPEGDRFVPFLRATLGIDRAA